MLSATPTFMYVLLGSLRPQPIPRVRLPRHLAAQGVDRGAGGKENRLQVGAAKGEVGGDLRRADDAEPRAVGGKYPSAARAGAIDPALDIDLHAVGHAVGLLRGHVGEDAPAHHVAGAVELDRVDVLGMARIGDVEDALVGGESEAV